MPQKVIAAIGRDSSIVSRERVGGGSAKRITVHKSTLTRRLRRVFYSRLSFFEETKPPL
jgi:hypothetical protein